MKKILLIALLTCGTTFAFGSQVVDPISIEVPDRVIKKVDPQDVATNDNPVPSKKRNSFTYCNPYKTNSFCNMVQQGNYTAVKKMIEDGEDVNKVSHKLTPLMYAARHNRADIVQLLIDNGAKISTRSHKGYTALKWAKMVNATASVEVLNAAIKKGRK